MLVLKVILLGLLGYTNCIIMSGSEENWSCRMSDIIECRNRIGKFCYKENGRMYDIKIYIEKGKFVWEN